MSTLESMISLAEDRWPSGGEVSCGRVQSEYTRLERSRWPPSVSAVAVSRAPERGTRTVALAARGTPVSRALSRPLTTTRT